MKNKKLLALLALTASLSFVMSACSFFGGDEPEEQIVVEATPTPEPTKEPEPTPTIAPDIQDTTYTSANQNVSIDVPDATWAVKTDQADLLSFESPEQGKILVTHGQGEEDMSSAVIPTTQDTAVALEQASEMEQGTDFEIQDFAANDVGGIGVYSYTVKYLNTEKSGGYAYSVNKIFANDQEFFSIEGSVVNDDAAVLANVKNSIESFKIGGASTLSAAAPAAAGGEAGTADPNAASGAEGTTDPNAAGTTDAQTTGSTGSTKDRFTEEQLTDTSQTRTIYRNSDGHPLVITPDGNGNWVDFDGNTYEFVNNEDVYDQDGVDYYFHGEAADVYYMPVE